MFVFHFGKASLSLCLFVSRWHFFVCVPRYQHCSLTFRTTRVEDTSNTSDYSISGRGEQLFVKITVTDMQERFQQVSIPVESIIPWLYITYSIENFWK